MLDREDLATYLAQTLDRASSTYVWEVENKLPTNQSVAVTIDQVKIRLDLRFVHERRYALGILFGYRNPQADIDRFLLRNMVRPGDIVLDAGANIGITAAEALGNHAAHVVCVEPEEDLASRLRAIENSHRHRISVWPLALSFQEGVADLLLSDTHNQGHTLSPSIAELFPSIFSGRRQRVDTTTIDAIATTLEAGKAPTVWKLDIEGMEANAIKGAYRTLQRSPPRVILAELYDPFVDEVVRLLPEYNVRRAALSKSSYDIKFLDRIGGPLSDEFCETSPMYAFSRRA